MAENSKELEQHADYYESCSDEFHEYADNFHTKTRAQKKQKALVKKTGKQPTWNVGDSQQTQIRKITSMEMPDLSNEVLAKLLINHQLKEVKSVIKVGTNSILLRGKVNEKNQNYRDLESNDVIIKIFTKKNHTKPDVEAAKAFKLFAFSKDRNKAKPPHNGSFAQNENMDCENIVLVQLENIVIMKMIGQNHPPKNIIDILKEAPLYAIVEGASLVDLEWRYYVNWSLARPHFRKLLELIPLLKYRNMRFWRLKVSMKSIFWHNNEWVILNKDNDDVLYKNSPDYIASNLALLVKTFERFGVENSKLKEEFFRMFEDKRKSSMLKRILKFEECMKILSWE